MIHLMTTSLPATLSAPITIPGALPRSQYIGMALIIRPLDALVRLLNCLNDHPPCGHGKRVLPNRITVVICGEEDRYGYRLGTRKCVGR